MFRKVFSRKSSKPHSINGSFVKLLGRLLLDTLIESVWNSNSWKFLLVRLQNDHLPSNSENFPSPPDTESKDRDLEDIDVIAPLNTELSESDNTDFISEQPRLNGSAVSNDNKIYEKSDNSKKRDDWSNKNEEEEEKDTCCTSCLLLTLNICDCVIL